VEKDTDWDFLEVLALGASLLGTKATSKAIVYLKL
jgi:hypothetical protein